MNTTVSPITARLAVPLFVCLSVMAGRPTVAAAEEGVLFMFVMNQSGQPVLDVSADELQLEQGGAECEIVSVQPETEGMKIALLVDTSAPAALSLTSLRDGLRAFFETLPDGHEVGLFTIAGQIRLRVDFTTDRAALLEQTENLFAERSEGAVLLDGLVETWDRRFDEDDPWPVFVMVVYDGAETSGSVRINEFSAFVEELRFRGATAHAVLVSTRGGGVQTDISVNITNNTGGIYKVLAAATALPVTLTELATSMGAHYDEVKNRYRVVFECDPDNPQAQIGLRVDRPAVGVRLFADRRPSP